MQVLAHALLGQHASLQNLVAELVERADGNPFFLEQWVITLIDEGTLVGTPGVYRLARPLSEFRPPASIAALICARVDRLVPEAKLALEAAAVLGDRITVELIAAMQQVDVDKVAQWLRLGVASGLVNAPSSAAVAQGLVGFRHALVQEVVLATLTRQRRKALHRDALRALSQCRADGGDDADADATLARHAFQGEAWEEAAAFAVPSIARAVACSANREAMRLFELGVNAAQRVADPARALALELPLLLEAIGALMALGQIDAIFANLERAETLAAQLDDQRGRATVALQTSVFLWMRGRYTQGLACADQAIEVGRVAGRRQLLMAASQTRMMLLHGLGRYAEAAALAGAVLKDFDAELRKNRPLAGWATAPVINLHAFWANSLSRMGDFAAAQQACDRAYALLEHLDHPYSRGLLDYSQGQMWVDQGRFDEAQALLRASVEMCTRHDVPTLLPVAVAMLGAALAQGGQPGPALTLLEDALHHRIHSASGVYGEFFLRLHQGTALRQLGRPAEAVLAGEEAVKLALAGEQHGHHVDGLYELALSLRAAGDGARALCLLQEALDQACSLGMAPFAQRVSQAMKDPVLGAPGRFQVPVPSRAARGAVH
jgi:tetratricopeptide (TPR) repeat protein